MSVPKTVYRARLPIPELGVEPGDIITVRPSHPDNPLLVTRRHERGRIALVLQSTEALTVLDGPATATLTLIR